MLSGEALKILELTEGASRTEIRHAYARLSKIYHVETHPEEFSRLHEAYKVALAAAGKAGAETQNQISPDTSKRPTSWDRQDTDADSSRPETGQDADASHPGEEQDKGRDSSRPETGQNADASHPGAGQDKGRDSSRPETGQDADASHPGAKRDTSTEPLSGDILDRLLGTNFSIQNCSKLIQLLYYRCRYDEISPEINAVLLRITNAERGITDDAHFRNIHETVASLPDYRNFLGTPWKTWKKLDWTCIVCHPDFYRMQYTPAFLDELYRFLLEETLNLRGGIGQELYFALCISYGFFSSEEDTAREGFAKNPLLAEIEKLLRLHPKHQEYIKDLALWPDCQQSRRIVLFCQKAYHILAPEKPLTPRTAKTAPPSGAPADNPPAFADSQTAAQLSETAAQLLLDEEIPWKEFIYDRLAASSCGSLFSQFTQKRDEFRRLCELRAEFTRDFIHLLDNHVDENYIYNACYLPLAIRLDRIQNRYLTKKEWKKIICRPDFFQAFKNWLFPRRNGFSSVPCIMHYDAWKMLRICFEGDSPFEKDSIRYLTTEFYFPEYEKRYQRELAWEEAHIEEAYFKESFPVPALSQGKQDLLDTIKDAAPASIAEIEKIFGNLTFDAAGLDFLTRITNAMTHFNFLLVTQKREKDAVPGDAFCFLENEVLLYRKKENLLCRLTHPVFYDLISWKFEAAAFPTINGRAGYDEEFLNTACKNLYCYRCYATQKKWYDPPAIPLP